MTQTPVRNSQTPDTARWSTLLQQLLNKESLSVDQATELIEGWLADSIPPVLSGAILTAIQAKRVSPEELVGMAQVLQSQSLGGIENQQSQRMFGKSKKSSSNGNLSVETNATVLQEPCLNLTRVT